MNDTLKAEIKEAIVRSLRLPMKPAEIGDSVPLFGEGLGLDSIDVLELVLEIERVFGASITDEDTGKEVRLQRRHDCGVHLRAAAREIDVISRPRPIRIPGRPRR